jgi:hypothetical protein
MNIESSKKAIKAAADFYKTILGDKQGADIRVEGIEMVENNYKITLSYPENAGYMFVGESERHYNTFIINDKFEMVSMKAGYDE